MPNNWIKIPNGYPKTESGVEQKLLAKLFSPEEANLASTLSLEPQSVKNIAQKNNTDEVAIKPLLKSMVKKGLIGLERVEGTGLAFCLIPFVVGVYENQNANIDKEFAELFEAYYNEGFYKVMTVEPSVHRVIPIEKTIPVNIDVMSYERASFYLDNANSWGVLNCICRVQQSLIGKACEHPIENCLVFSGRANAFDKHESIKALTKEEALEVLAEADRAGLVHSTNNAQEDVNYICNCCTCSCGVLRGMIKSGSKSAIARSDFYAVVNNEMCSGCEICLERCQFNAIKMNDCICEVDTAFCFGCGLCVTTCATEALSLKQKEGTELIPPVQSEKEWRVIREKAYRGL